MIVQKTGQTRLKLQPITATVATTTLVVAWRPRQCTTAEGEARDRSCWLVEVCLAKVGGEPLQRPVETAEQATASFRMVLSALEHRGRL